MASSSVEIYYDQVLGSGAYGTVSRAKYGQLPCAAKLIHDVFLDPTLEGSYFVAERFERECQLLSRLKHPHIVMYLGTFKINESQRSVLLMELMDEDLTMFLDRSIGSLSHQTQLTICHDVALALSYLHSNAIIHADLSSNSVLLSHKIGIIAKVADFDSSIDLNTTTPQVLCPGNVNYMSPEALLSPPHYSEKLDCFSFGVLTLQVLTRNFPQPEHKANAEFTETERRKKDIYLIDPNHPLLLLSLHCLHDNDTERPSADRLCKRLATLKRKEAEFREESQKFFANIKKHLDKSGAINRYLAHLVFVGLPGSGKTTLILRLLSLTEIQKILKLRDLASTGIVDGIISVNVAEDKASLYTASMDKNYEWHEVQFGLSCLRQMGIQCFVSSKTPENDNLARPSSLKPAKVNSESQNVYAQRIPNKTLSSDAKANLVHPSTAEQSLAEDVMETVQRLLAEQGFDAVLPYLDNKTTLYLSDTGGQIEFQELLPLLVALHAIFVFLFPLNVDLDAPVTVSYRKKVGDKLEHTNVYTSSLTIRESFLQTLASIDSKDDSVNPSVAKHKPYVFVVGTHKDCLIDELGEAKATEKIAEIDSKIKSLVKEHQYEDMVVYADKAKNEVLFAVDNTCENDVFPKIRKGIFDLLHSGNEFLIEFPLSYLLASLHLQSKSEPFIKRSEFAQEVLQYGIEEEDIDYLLQFLHTRIGQIRYFPLEEIKEVIVKEPQALYNLVTCLLTKSFISRNVTMKQNTEVQKGIYSFESFCDEEFFSQSEFLTPKRIILLLKELRIVAPFFDHNAEVEKYFIPCVLEHLVEPPDDSSCKMSPVQPLAIMFDCGHCPKGLFGVLLHYLVTHQNSKLNWSLDINKIFRNRVSFEVGPYEDEVTLKFYSTYLEVGCHPFLVQGRDQAYTLKKFCNMIHCDLASGIKDATKSLNYSATKTQHSLGLVCTDCNQSHRVINIKSQFIVRCPRQECRPLLETHPGSYWFGVPPSITFPSLARHRIFSLKEGRSDRLGFLVTSDPSLSSQSEHHLLKQEDSFCGTHVYIEDNELIFKNVQRSDAGTYTVMTSNAAGEGRASFQLNIRTPPEYLLQTSFLEVEAGSSPTVTFTVTSDPPLPEGTEHTLSKSNGTKATRKFKVENNSITLHNVTLEDSGTYTISCCNEEGDMGQATLELKVTSVQPSSSLQTDHSSSTETGTVVKSEEVNMLSYLPPKEFAYSRTTGNGTIVKSKDVSMLVCCLHKYAYKWREIGGALNFEHSELESIRVYYPWAPPPHLLTVLLSEWSQWPTTEHSDLPTMEKLCDALRSGMVGLGAVADDIYLLRHELPSQQSSSKLNTFSPLPLITFTILIAVLAIIIYLFLFVY